MVESTIDNPSTENFPIENPHSISTGNFPIDNPSTPKFAVDNHLPLETPDF